MTTLKQVREINKAKREFEKLYDLIKLKKEIEEIREKNKKLLEKYLQKENE